jgi:hypothetical protein
MSVVRIETAPNSSGETEIASGFLVGNDPHAGGRLLLITNKHVVGDWNYADANIRNPHPWIDVFFYRTSDPSGQRYRATRIKLTNNAGALDETRIRLHARSQIDVASIDVSDRILDQSEHIAFVAYDKSYLIRSDQIKDWQTNIGDQVIALGYPLGIRSTTNNYPFAKIGYLSSVPGEPLSIPIPSITRRGVTIPTVIEGKLLVVDGLIVGGNSGGPVILVGGIRTRRDPATNQLQFSNRPVENRVIGIVSANLGPSGLTVVLAADYILDLL